MTDPRLFECTIFATFLKSVVFWSIFKLELVWKLAFRKQEKQSC